MPPSRAGVRNAFFGVARRERASDATSGSLGMADGRHVGPHDRMSLGLEFLKIRF